MQIFGSALSGLLNGNNSSRSSRSTGQQGNTNPLLALLNSVADSSTSFSTVLDNDKPARRQTVGRAKSRVADNTVDEMPTRTRAARAAVSGTRATTVSDAIIAPTTTTVSDAVIEPAVTPGTTAASAPAAVAPRVLDDAKVQADLGRHLVAQSKNSGSLNGYGGAAAVGCWVLETLTGKSPTEAEQQAAMNDIVTNGSAAFIDKTLASKDSQDYFRKADGTVDTSSADLDSIRALAKKHGDNAHAPKAAAAPAPAAASPSPAPVAAPAATPATPAPAAPANPAHSVPPPTTTLTANGVSFVYEGSYWQAYWGDRAVQIPKDSPAVFTAKVPEGILVFVKQPNRSYLITNAEGILPDGTKVDQNRPMARVINPLQTGSFTPV